METTSQVARFIADRIDIVGLRQREIAEISGFESPNIISMLKTGQTKLPLDKVGPMAKALETDPLRLLTMCMEEYYPKTWQAIGPYFESTLSKDELELVRSMRKFIGKPFVVAMGPPHISKLNDLLQSLQQDASTLQ